MQHFFCSSLGNGDNLPFTVLEPRDSACCRPAAQDSISISTLHSAALQLERQLVLQYKHSENIYIYLFFFTLQQEYVLQPDGTITPLNNMQNYVLSEKQAGEILAQVPLV